MNKIKMVAAVLSLLGVWAQSGCGGSSESSQTSLTVTGSMSSTEAVTLTLKNDITPQGSPSSLTMNIYAFYVSQNEDCTDPQLVADNGATAQSYDFSAAPTLFSVDGLAEASYHCLIMKMQDVLSFKPDSVAETAFPDDCHASSTYTFDIYRDDSGDDGTWHDVDGHGISATGTDSSPSADTVYIVASTSPTAATSGALGFNTNQVVTLSAPLTIPGNITFYADFGNSVVGSSGECGVERGTLGFR